jgi:hypothetical protein
MASGHRHVEVAVRFEPVLVHPDRERPDQAQAARGAPNDPDHVGALLDLLVQALEQVGRLQVRWGAAASDGSWLTLTLAILRMSG